MNRIFFVAVFALIANLSFAQKNYQDVIYLKNGSIIRGLIIEQVVNKSFKIETTDNNVFVFEIDEIEKIAKEPLKGKSKKNPINKEFKPGSYRIIDGGYSLGVRDRDLSFFKLNFTYGYQFSRFFFAGIGSGLWYDESSEAAIVPIFADFRTPILNRNISPFISMGLGYAFDATNNMDGVGYFLNPNLGFSVMISKDSKISFSIGHKWYKFPTMDFYYFSDDNHFEPFRSLTFCLGITF